MADENSGSCGGEQQKGKRAEAGKAVLALTHRRIAKVESEREIGTMPTTGSVEAMIEEIETTLREMQAMSKEREGAETTTTKKKGKGVKAVQCSKETTLKTISEEGGDGDSDGNGRSDKIIKATRSGPVGIDITRGSEEVINRFKKLMQRADTLLKDQREWIDRMTALRLAEKAENERKNAEHSQGGKE